MTDTALNGSADGAGSSDEIISEAGGERSAPATSSLFDSLGEDNRRVAEAKGWDSADKIVESYRNLETKIGDSLRPPADDAPAEEWQAFYGRLGRPDHATDYEFKMPGGLAEDFPYDSESATRFGAWAHEAGLTPRQAQSLHDRFVQDLNGQFTARDQGTEDAASQAHDALVELWGEPATERYQRNVELSDRALRELGGPELAQSLRDRGALSEHGEILDPAIASMLQKAGERFCGEDRVFGANGRAHNPFSSPTENITEQGRLLRSDPELARTYIRAANREQDFPRLFGNEF